MKILITGDWHLNANPRDQYRHDHQKVLRQVIVKYGVDKLVVLGDLTDEKDNHPAWLVNKIADYVHTLAQHCRVIIVRGNHDALTPDEPFFGFLGLIPNVIWVNQPRVIDGDIYLPFTNNWKKDWEQVVWSVFNRAFTHNTFDGVSIGHGETLKGIPLSAVKVPTFSGDIHIPQTLDGVTYVGAPYLVDFGDDYVPRLLLVEGQSVKSLRLPGRQKRLVEVRSLDALDKVTGVNPGDILKVRFQLSPADHAQWPALQAAIRKWGEEHDYQIHTIVPLVLGGQQRSHPQIRRARSGQDDKALINEYAKARGIAEPTIKVGLALIEEV
jgi:hypothetical protein